MSEASADVIIIGAGMAGLTAARALAEAGLHPLLLEARNRVGGRIHTQQVEGQALEIGAEFVHGRPPELWAMLQEAGLETSERDGSQLCFEDGQLTACGTDGMDDSFRILADLKTYSGPDLSFRQYLDQQGMPAEACGSVTGYVEGFNAASAGEISLLSLGAQQAAEDAIEGDLVFHIRRGYNQLPLYLASRLAEFKVPIHLQTIVQSIHWHPGHVDVIASQGTFTASRVIVTLPLGVLQSNRVPITPAPEAVLAAVGQLRMGHVRRFTLLFREPFWQSLTPRPEAQTLSFLYSFTEMPPVWWTQHPEPGNAITGWVGGPRSEAYADFSAKQITGAAIASLARIFQLDPSHLHGLLVTCATHDWQQDPFACGAYSYVASGGIAASHTLSQPVENTLYFAGEHTDTTGHWGTVHAAIRSGLRAANQIIERTA